MSDQNLFLQKLKTVWDENGFSLTEEQGKAFYIYYTLLVERNKHMNLTGITDEDGVIEKHFLDSLLPLKTGRIGNGTRCLDVGSGAGFPGIPLAIMAPHATFVLADSLQKRIAFLDEVIEFLHLDNATTWLTRAEAAGHSEHRETFDVVLSRAVANLSTLAELCLPLVRTGGEMMALKSVSAKNELAKAQKALQTLGAGQQTVFGTEERNLICIQKQTPTPDKYPRRDGVPERKPL